MGLYDRVLLENDVELPAFPHNHRPTEIRWQTKAIGMPSLGQFKLTASGRLLRHEQEMREKTAAEKRAEATEHGFDSWDEYVSFYDDADPQELRDRGMGIRPPSNQTVAEEFWVDHNQHGTFEFHGGSDDVKDGYFWSYEARFTNGDLDGIVFLGERGASSS